MIEKAVAAIQQLAKRQLTWLRGWPSLEWLESGDDGNLMTILQRKSLNLRRCDIVLNIEYIIVTLRFC